jgi:hypothetical protein
MKPDIHQIERQLDGITRIISASKKMNENNKAMLLRYKNECYAEGLTSMRIVRCLYLSRT